MAGTIYTGKDAKIWLRSGAWVETDDGTLTHSTLAISDFSLTLSKDTVEQNLVGELGNYFLAGGLSAEGSLTACKMHNSAIGKLVGFMINSTPLNISGNCGANNLHFFLQSCQVTGFDFSIATAGDITEGTIDFTVLYPYALSATKYETDSYKKITTNTAWL